MIRISFREVILKPEAISNQHRLIFYGETFNDIIDKFPSYNIPMVARNFLREQNINLENNLNDIIGNFNTLDLVVSDYYKYAVDIYTEICRRNTTKEKTEISGYRLLLKYLKKIRSNLDLVDDDKIREVFFNKKDVENAKRIFKGERMFMDKKIEELKNYLKGFRKFKKMLETKSKDGIVDLSDL